MAAARVRLGGLSVPDMGRDNAAVRPSARLDPGSIECTTTGVAGRGIVFGAHVAGVDWLKDFVYCEDIGFDR